MASDVHKNTDTKVETVSANSVCRQLPQKTAEQGLAAAVAFAEEVQWSLAIRRTISGVGFGEALKLLMNDRDVSVEQMESESGLSVSTIKRLRAGQNASVEQIVAISVALHLPPPVSGDLLRMCKITLDFNDQENTVYQMILTEYYKEGIEQVNVCLAASSMFRWRSLKNLRVIRSRCVLRVGGKRTLNKHPLGGWVLRMGESSFLTKLLVKL